VEKGMGKKENNTNFIVVTGSESTGKTQLAEQLAQHLNCDWIPELSRKYIQQLGRSYTYTDVEAIALQQIEQFKAVQNTPSKRVVFDTGLIITKVWFDVVYDECPQWLIQTITNLPKTLHLLCDTDLEWVPDTVRENGGEMREKLSQMYANELVKFGFPYALVSGIGDNRLKNAIRIIEDFGIK
jgi:nicotinamide riboside kinase